jgi:transmembrane sensor
MPSARTPPVGAPSPGGFSPEVVHRAVSYWVAQLSHGQDASRAAASFDTPHPEKRDKPDGTPDLAVWRAAHPEHERAWQHLQSVSRRLQSVDGSAAPQTDQSAAVGSEEMHAAQRRAALSSLPGVTARRPKAPGRRRAVLKTSLMIVGFGSAGWLLTETVRDPLDFRTDIGETRVAVLDDGTRMTLDTHSAVQVRFTKNERRLILVRGAIMIQTGHAMPYADRPFILQTAQGTLTPLGTRFAASESDGRTQLDVFEGAVRIQPKQTSTAGPVIRPGERVSFDTATLSPVTSTPAGADAWVDGMLVANGMPLADFCAALSRYRPGLLQCGADVGRLRISGTYPVHDTERVLDALSQNLPVRIVRLTRYWTRVVSSAA